MRKHFVVRTPAHFESVKYPVILVTIGEYGYEEGGRPEALPEAVAEAALAGSMFGWACPAARPALDFARQENEGKSSGPDSLFTL